MVERVGEDELGVGLLQVVGLDSEDGAGPAEHVTASATPFPRWSALVATLLGLASLLALLASNTHIATPPRGTR